MAFTFEERVAVSGAFRRLGVSDLEQVDGSDRNPLYSIQATARRFTWASLIYTVLGSKTEQLQSEV